MIRLAGGRFRSFAERPDRAAVTDGVTENRGPGDEYVRASLGAEPNRFFVNSAVDFDIDVQPRLVDPVPDSLDRKSVV